MENLNVKSVIVSVVVSIFALVVGGFAALFLVLGGVFYKALARATQRAEPAFAASLAELEEDLRQLKAAARDGSTTH